LRIAFGAAVAVFGQFIKHHRHMLLALALARNARWLLGLRYFGCAGPEVG
jgi:hypothetical protein